MFLFLLVSKFRNVDAYAFTTSSRNSVLQTSYDVEKRFETSYTDFVVVVQSRKTICMKVSKGKSKHSKGNSLNTLNNERKKLAGRRGTKNFVDPNKVFVGNLPYDADEDEIMEWLCANVGGKIGKHNNIESFKLIRDWKTGKSKGYGFINFMDPMYATSAMEFLKGRKLRGRYVNLNQGKRKEQEEQKLLIIQKREEKKKRQLLDEESQVIDAALDMAEEDAGDEYEVEDFDSVDDSILFGADSDDEFDDEDDDDEDFEFDGVFEEIYGRSKYEPLDEEEAKNMNREQRRDTSTRKKRKKLPRKGFGE